ncbi:MAG: hypothetical protein ACLP5E_16805 [Streptosporangiaceae bacterium]
MTDPEPPRVGDDTLVGPDEDLEREDSRRAPEARLTGAVAGMIIEQIRQAAGRLPRPDLSGAQRPDLIPLPELLGELVADLRELRLRDRLAEGLRQLAGAIERTKVH